MSIAAHELGLVDLDEYGSASQLANRIEADVSPAVENIVLDLRKCWLEYSNTAIFLDSALKTLRESSSLNEKELILKLSIDFGAADSMASLLFQISKQLECTAKDKPAEIVARLNRYCVENAIALRIETYGFHDDGDAAMPKKTYTFPG
ncbi:hypothetical protein [Herbaspirillum camelliae]|uniref:hypothetical protein n=1 Tax=Herbaspirillum camelliae TaxID=1892903 RepID=UPI0011799362|nr:hypothetical protein [Herbaspirillum camelliae]